MWTQVVLTSAALLIAVGIIWSKFLKPTYKAARTIEEAVPPLLAAAAAFKGDPVALEVLQKIASQFRSDSGSTLKDAINRLEAAVEALTVTLALLERKAEIQVRLDESDRRHMERLAQALDRVDVKVDLAKVSADLAKGAASAVAADLAVAQGQVDAVADDLARRSERADAVAEGQPGEAADAGMRSQPTEGSPS